MKQSNFLMKLLLRNKRNIKKDIETNIAKLEAYFKELKENKIYQNALEWRIEFPEILEDESGRFIGFDVIIGNSSYISTKEISEEYKEELKKNFGFADDTYNHFLFL